MVSAFRSAATYLSLALYVLLIGPPFVLIALLFGKRALLYRVGHLGVRLGLSLSGIRVTVEGTEHIQRHRAAVYAVNHASSVEPPIIFDLLHELFPRLRILYKAELRKLPVLVKAFDLAEFIPLERGNPEQSLPAIDRAARALQQGNSFLIFPEGTRSRTGELLPFKEVFIPRSMDRLPGPDGIAGARTRCGMQPASTVHHPAHVEPVETAECRLTIARSS